MKLTTKMLRQIIREELQKIAESDPNKLPGDLMALGPMGYLFNKMRPNPKRKKQPETAPTRRRLSMTPLEKARLDREEAELERMRMPPPPTAAEIASELRSSNLIATPLDDSLIRVKLKDQRGKTVNRDFFASQGTQSIIDQIMQEFPNAMMQASKRGMRRRGDMVDIQDPMMERKNKKRRIKNA